MSETWNTARAFARALIVAVALAEGRCAVCGTEYALLCALADDTGAMYDAAPEGHACLACAFHSVYAKGAEDGAATVRALREIDALAEYDAATWEAQ